MVPGYQRISTISALILLALIAIACIVLALAEGANAGTDCADGKPAAVSSAH
jgi:uncharacterized membrane protein